MMEIYLGNGILCLTNVFVFLLTGVLVMTYNTRSEVSISASEQGCVGHGLMFYTCSKISLKLDFAKTYNLNSKEP
jgi:hypothetical protein